MASNEKKYIYVFIKRHNAAASETLTATDYILLPVREINPKICTPIIMKQFIQPGLGIEPRPG